MSLITCPICNELSKFEFTTQYHEINRCTNLGCRHLFATNAAKYQGVIPSLAVNSANYEKRNEHLIQYWLRHNFVRNGCSILDFGSGSGHIVKSLKEQLDSEITCIEAGKDYYARLQKFGCSVFSGIDQLAENIMFDAVLLIEVIEHLDMPVSTLRQIYKHLKKGGKLFVTTPTGDLRKPLKEPWRLDAYNTLHHVQFFNPLSLTLALRKAGFRRIYYRFVNEMYPNDEATQSDYESLWAKKFAFKKQLHHWRYGANHLTYFARN